MIEFLLSIIASLLAASLFFLVKNSFSPEIELSSEIAHSDHFGKPCYLVKVKNKKKRPIYNLKAEMFVATVFQKQEGQTEHTEEIPLKRKEVIELGPHLDKWEVHPDHIWRFLTFEDLQKLLNSDQTKYIKFVVSGHDSISGKGKTFKIRYNLEHICEGSFYVDNRMGIKPAYKVNEHGKI